MAVLDDLVQFVGGNTLGGSWQKPQLRKRCEEFLEDGGIVAPTGTISITENGTVDVTQYASASIEVSGGGTPDRITVGMIANFDWPVLNGMTDEATESMYVEGEEVDEILGAQGVYSPEDCSYKIEFNLEGNENTYICTEADGSIVYKNEDEYSFPKTVTISRHESVAFDFGEGSEGQPLVFNLVYDPNNDRYVLSENN